MSPEACVLRRLALAALALGLVACAPGRGPFVLEAVHGRVVDLQTGTPVAGAAVVEWYVGGGPSDGARPVRHARWATSRADGSFVLGESRTNACMWIARSYGPKFAFVHPDYGLQRQARQQADEWILSGDRRRIEQARADLRPFCRGELDDAGARHIRSVACKGSNTRPLR